MNLKKPLPLLLSGVLLALLLGLFFSVLFGTQEMPVSFHGPSFSSYVFGPILRSTFWIVLPYFLLFLLMGTIASAYVIVFQWVRDEGSARLIGLWIWASSILLGTVSIFVGVMCGLFLSAAAWSLANSAFGVNWQAGLFTTRGLIQFSAMTVGTVVAGSIFAAGLGLAQWWLFRRSFPETGPLDWVKICVLNWPTKFALGLSLAAVAVGLFDNLEPMVPLGVAGALAGISVGNRLMRFAENGELR